MSTPVPRDYPTPPDRAPGLPTTAVVICAYTDDRWNETLRAVASVQAQQPPPDELIVVIDHNPQLQDRIAAELPGVRVVANHNEQGLSGARNSGVELCESDVVVFLDDDAAAEPGWLAGLGGTTPIPTCSAWAAASSPSGPPPGRSGGRRSSTG